MDPRQLLFLLTALVVLGVGAQWVATRLRIPALLLLLLTGFCLGPLSALLLPEPVLDPEAVFGDLLKPVVSMFVALVLFEGGLTLDLAEARKAGRTLWLLILSGLVIGFSSVTLMALWIGGLDLATSATLGAILVVTGPTVILPMLRSARIAWRPATLLKWEGIVNDPFGALLAFFVLDIAMVSGRSESGVVVLGLELLGKLLLAAALGYLLARMLVRALEGGSVPEHLKNPLMLAGTLFGFAVGELVEHELGLVTVTVLGMGLANQHTVDLERIRWFKEQISYLLVALLFLVLSAKLSIQDLQRLEARHLLLLGMILLVARPLTVLAATWRSDLPWQERALVSWIAPRGVVAAAVAGAFAPDLVDAGFEDGRLLVPIVFGVIVATVTLHGLTIGPMAQKLGLASKGGKGILLVGASDWHLDLAETLEKAGAFVILADARFSRISKARMRGLQAYHGDVLSEDLELELPLERIHTLLAATDDDSYNTLVCHHYLNDFGRNSVHQLQPEKGLEKPGLQGNTPWGEDAGFRKMARRYWRGWKFRSTNLSEEYDWARFREDNPEGLPLFAIEEKGLRLLGIEDEAGPGTKVLHAGPGDGS